MINRIISMFVSLWLAVSSFLTGVVPVSGKLRIVVPENWELCVGDSRTLECVFDKKVRDRRLEWSAEPENVAAVDKWGRVTALAEGKATITAEGDGFSDSVELQVVATPTMIKDRSILQVNYGGTSIDEVNNLQKLAVRFPHGSNGIPSYVSSITDYSAYQTAVTADGAVWEITDYGVLRTDKNAPTERDVEQRFMGERYFYSNDTSKGKVLAIVPDGGNGIWTVMEEGVSHIDMIEASAEFKATYLSGVTQQNVSRFGYVDMAFRNGDGWKSTWSDNDGLWTSM